MANQGTLPYHDAQRMSIFCKGLKVISNMIMTLKVEQPYPTRYRPILLTPNFVALFYDLKK